jgi:hypothetical protein
LRLYIKGRDRVLGNLLDVARRVSSGGHGGGLRAICAEAVVRTAGLGGMQRLPSGPRNTTSCATA